MTIDWLIDFPDSRNTSHLSCFLCLSSPTEAPPLWMKFSYDLWSLGSAFVSSPVTTNNSWIAVNASAAASPPSPLWTIGLHSTCTNRTLSWELYYQLCCIWYLRFPSYNAFINWTTVIKQRLFHYAVLTWLRHFMQSTNMSSFNNFNLHKSHSNTILEAEFTKILSKACRMSCWKWPI